MGSCSEDSPWAPGTWGFFYSLQRPEQLQGTQWDCWASQKTGWGCKVCTLYKPQKSLTSHFIWICYLLLVSPTHAFEWKVAIAFKSKSKCSQYQNVAFDFLICSDFLYLMWIFNLFLFELGFVSSTPSKVTLSPWWSSRDLTSKPSNRTTPSDTRDMEQGSSRGPRLWWWW